MSGTFERGSRVRFTSGPLGTITLDNPYRFTPLTVPAGSEGMVYSDDGTMPDGWLLVRLDETDDQGRELFVPIHPEQLELVDRPWSVKA